MEPLFGTVYTAAQLWFGMDEPPTGIVVNTWLRVYETLSRVRYFPTPCAAVVHAVLRECLGYARRVSGTVAETTEPSPDAMAVHAEKRTDAPSLDAVETPEILQRLFWISRLSDDDKLVVLTFLLVDGAVSTTARTLRRPRKYVEHRLQAAFLTAMTHESGADREADTWDSIRSALIEYATTVEVPEAKVTEARQRLLAHAARLDAEQRQRGPRWVTYGMAAASVLALAAIAYGVSGRSLTVSAAAPSALTASKANNLPPPVGNFPGVVLAQFRLAGDAPSTTELQHLAVTSSALYIPTLSTTSTSWPSITVEKIPFTGSGESLTAHPTPAGKMDLLPPSDSADSNGNTKHIGWVVKRWDFRVTGRWAVAVVEWSAADESSTTISQLYLLSLTTGKSSLVKTFDGGEQSVIAVGDGKVVVQTAVVSGGTTGSAAKSSGPVSLPIDVYTLRGDVPLQALGEAKQLAAPFGFMKNPVITGDRLIFQGVAGQVSADVGVDETWYGLSWDGQLSRLDGPPMDGRPHWAVQGTSGQPWWVETTPDDTDSGSIQVLFHALADTGGVNQTPAQSLAGPVQWFTVSDQYTAWVQQTDNVKQLVIGEPS